MYKDFKRIVLSLMLFLAYEYITNVDIVINIAVALKSLSPFNIDDIKEDIANKINDAEI